MRETGHVHISVQSFVRIGQDQTTKCLSALSSIACTASHLLNFRELGFQRSSPKRLAIKPITAEALATACRELAETGTEKQNSSAHCIASVSLSNSLRMGGPLIAGRKFELPQECQEPAVRAMRRSTRVRIHIAVLLILYTVWVGFQIVASLINAFRTSNDAVARKRPFPCWRYLQISAMSYRAPAPGCAWFASSTHSAASSTNDLHLLLPNIG